MHHECVSHLVERRFANPGGISGEERSAPRNIVDTMRGERAGSSTIQKSTSNSIEATAATLSAGRLFRLARKKYRSHRMLMRSSSAILVALSFSFSLTLSLSCYTLDTGFTVARTHCYVMLYLYIPLTTAPVHRPRRPSHRLLV